MTDKPYDGLQLPTPQHPTQQCCVFHEQFITDFHEAKEHGDAIHTRFFDKLDEISAQNVWILRTTIGALLTLVVGLILVLVKR